MATTLRCRPWLKCTTGRWRCISTARVSLRPAVPGLVPPCLTPPPFPASEPINTFHGIHQNNDEPIRVSYHRNIHYNSVVNPNKATIGVGLGLPAFKPGVAAPAEAQSPPSGADACAVSFSTQTSR